MHWLVSVSGMTRSTLSRPVALLAGLIAMSLLAGCHGGDGGSDLTSTSKYVALGDSASSGYGIAGSHGSCGRSDRNYPSLLAKALTIKHVADVTCGGATTADITNPAVRFDGGRLAPQLDAVTSGDKLVTIGIGGNDSHLFPILFASCFTPPTNTPAACQTAITQLTARLGTIRDSIVGVLGQIKARAPQAKVVLVGYLRWMPDSGTCAPAIPIVEPQISAAAKLEADLDDTMRQAAAQAGVTYVSMRKASAGHDACAGNDAWVNGVTTTGDGAVLHPRAAGARAVAKAVRAALKAG